MHAVRMPSHMSCWLAVFGLGQVLAAQQPFTWTIQSGGAPPAALPAVASAAAYDTTRGRAVFHPVPSVGGGAETWEWDGVAWTQVPAAPPLVLAFPSMAYDAVNQRTVMFGGYLTTLRDDTFVWDGAAWQPTAPALRPQARMRAGLFFDQVRQSVVLVGGTANDPSVFPPSPSNDLADTWEWDGQAWSQLAPAQAPEPGPCVVAYDAARGRAVLLPVFGANTWEWDGATWAAVPSAQMPPIQPYGVTTMTFDPSRGRVVYSGSAGTSAPEQWEWDGSNWVPLGTSRWPSLPLVFDAANQAMLLVEDPRIWLSENAAPQFSASASPYGSGCGALQLVPNSVPWIGQTAELVAFGMPVPSPIVATTFLAAGFAPLTGVSWPVPGCDVLQTADVIGLAMTQQVATASFDLPIPYLASLRGLALYLQAFAFAPGQNAASVVLSNGVELVLGDN